MFGSPSPRPNVPRADDSQSEIFSNLLGQSGEIPAVFKDDSLFSLTSEISMEISEADSQTSHRENTSNDDLPQDPTRSNSHTSRRNRETKTPKLKRPSHSYDVSSPKDYVKRTPEYNTRPLCFSVVSEINWDKKKSNSNDQKGLFTGHVLAN